MGRGRAGGRRWGEGCRQVGEENRHSQKSQNKTDRQIIQKTGEENKTKWTNRKRIGNLLIKANHTGESILVQIYISPTQTRERWWQPAVPRTLVCTVTGRVGPLLLD